MRKHKIWFSFSSVGHAEDSKTVSENLCVIRASRGVIFCSLVCVFYSSVSDLRGLKYIFVSFQELVQLSPSQTKLCIPARFVLSPYNSVSIKIQLPKLIWNKASLVRGQIWTPSVMLWKKDELLVLLLSGWNALSSFKACLKSYKWLTTTISTIPILQRKICLRPSNTQLFFFLSFL